MGGEMIKTARTKVRRMPERGVYEREAIYRILDEACVCHVGFTVDGQPFVIPTAYARVGDRLYLHGSAASRMLRALAREVEACVTVTLVDGLVLARSAFHHSMNYRSVAVFGTATVVRGEGEKLKALEAFTEHIMPGRWRDVRTRSHARATGCSVSASGGPERSCSRCAGICFTGKASGAARRSSRGTRRARSSGCSTAARTTTSCGGK